MKTLILFLAASALALHTGVAVADAYRCVEKGKTTISSEPCPAGATSTVVSSVSVSDAEALAAARAEEDRLKQSVDTMTKARYERDAAYAAEQKTRAEQAALEAQTQRDLAEAAAAANPPPQRSVVYDWPIYGHDPGQGQGKPPHYGNSGNPKVKPRPPSGARPGAASKRQNTRHGVMTKGGREPETGVSARRGK
ncbi:hypothetical protein AGMMS49545_10880 [Betaproteobacteria bacterium]|nr:hypothetical protein AGMMS49545_10880 [Betaproteobacteria bacterium]GHU44568.1 hypothetical protein AGMMS50289_13150 [Betaproteobacteria bacterium]